MQNRFTSTVTSETMPTALPHHPEALQGRNFLKVLGNLINTVHQQVTLFCHKPSKVVLSVTIGGLKTQNVNESLDQGAKKCIGRKTLQAEVWLDYIKGWV